MTATSPAQTDANGLLAAAAWHTLEREVVERLLEATEAGLASSEAAVRLQRFGRNELPQQPTPAWWQIAALVHGCSALPRKGALSTRLVYGRRHTIRR